MPSPLIDCSIHSGLSHPRFSMMNECRYCLLPLVEFNDNGFLCHAKGKWSIVRARQNVVLFLWKPPINVVLWSIRLIIAIQSNRLFISFQHGLLLDEINGSVKRDLQKNRFPGSLASRHRMFHSGQFQHIEETEGLWTVSNQARSSCMATPCILKRKWRW